MELAKDNLDKGQLEKRRNRKEDDNNYENETKKEGDRIMKETTSCWKETIRMRRWQHIINWKLYEMFEHQESHEEKRIQEEERRREVSEIETEINEEI